MATNNELDQNSSRTARSGWQSLREELLRISEPQG